MTKQQMRHWGGELHFADVSVFAGVAAVHGNFVPASPAEQRVRVWGDGHFQLRAERRLLGMMAGSVLRARGFTAEGE